MQLAPNERLDGRQARGGWRRAAAATGGVKSAVILGDVVGRRVVGAAEVISGARGRETKGQLSGPLMEMLESGVLIVDGRNDTQSDWEKIRAATKASLPNKPQTI